MLSPFEKGKSLQDHGVPIAELLKQVTNVLKDTGGLKKKLVERK